MPRRWRSPAITLENTQTGDGRVFAPMAVEWADLPLPLAWMRDGDQHINLSEVAPQIGVITAISREGDAIPASGEIDDANPDGAEVIRRLEANMAPLGNRFPVSVDPDNWEVEIVASEGEEEMVLTAAAGRGPLTAGNLRETVRAGLAAAAGDPDPGDGGGDGVVLFTDTVDAIIERYTRVRLRGATLCSVAAFDGAWIELEAADAEPAEPAPADPEPVAASAVDLTAPPRAWFFEPEPEEGDSRLVEQVDGSWAVPLTITDDGHVFGHIARREQSHRGYVGRHVPPPTSRTGYREFHVGAVRTAEGEQVAAGAMVVGCDHAPPTMALLDARDHYAHSGMGWCDGRITDGRFGPWFSGALRPGLSDADLRVIRALAPSGDWRPAGDNLELCAVLSVNVPGFPIARESLAASALSAPATAPAAARVGLAEDGSVLSLVAAGMVERCSECAERQRRDVAKADADSAVTAAIRSVAALVASVQSDLARVERRTRHLEPVAASALRERVHGGNGR